MMCVLPVWTVSYRIRPANISDAGVVSLPLMPGLFGQAFRLQRWNLWHIGIMTWRSQSVIHTQRAFLLLRRIPDYFIVFFGHL